MGDNPMQSSQVSRGGATEEEAVQFSKRFLARGSCIAIVVGICVGAISLRAEPPEDEDAAPRDGAPRISRKPVDTPSTTKSAKEKSNAAQVEVYVPSVTSLVDAAKRSKTAVIYRVFSSLVAVPRDETGEGIDISHVLTLLTEISRWPDTSLEITTYTQDREGRPRWAVRVDWPLEALVVQLQALIQLEATGKLVKDLSLHQAESGEWRLELPDMVLAVLKKTKGGSLVLSAADVKPPEKIFGRKEVGDKKEKSLVYCRLNMEAGDDDSRGAGMLGQLSMLSDIRYSGMVDDAGLWQERFNLRWNAMLGLAIKQSLKKPETKFETPRDAMAAAVFSMVMAEGMADSLAGFRAGTIGARCGSDVAVSVIPGGGFLPLPDVFFQFRVRNPDGILKSVRKMMRDDAKARRADDKAPAWREDTIGNTAVFWKDPAADRNGGMSLITTRTVVFIEEPGADAGPDEKSTLVVAEIATMPDDAVSRWLERRGKSSTWERMPSAEGSSWEAVIHWATVYALVEPLLSVIGNMADDVSPLPGAKELAADLVESRVHLKIEYAGLDIRHKGPIPFGAAYVPAITAMSLSATADFGSEADRERVACRNLRTLYHHAKLFKKDYGRWPATVAELDGFVDFASHPYLLQLQPREDGFAANLVGMFATSSKPKVRREQGESVIDDTLFVIEGMDDEWRLAFKKDQFRHYETIYIDAEGEIHRVSRSFDSKETES
ncbi:MAG: hypothetical protein HZA51_01135 [Planctomycetes bacterium]|nr:hypothetical protein [Planctomycetota bacterium]